MRHSEKNIEKQLHFWISSVIIKDVQFFCAVLFEKEEYYRLWQN